MPETVTDEEWEKKPDGTMRLVAAVPRTLTDDEVAYSRAPADLRALRDKTTWTAADLQAAVRAIARILVPPDPPEPKATP